MRVADIYLDQYFEQGFTVVPDFLDADELAAARDALWTMFPRPEEYFADPGAHEALQRSQFHGLREFPFAHFDLNRIAVHDDLADVARRILETPEVRLYKGEVWAKYGGGVNHDQDHHRDFGNHTLVVPRADGYARALTTFIYLCDVSPTNGATAVVPRRHTDHIPLGVRRAGTGELRDNELLATGTAGSLLMYSTEIFHRGTALTDPRSSRFMILADYRAADAPWVQKQAFGNHGNRAEMIEFVTRATPAQRTLVEIPPPGHEYWNSQTIADMAIRYTGIDMSPYSSALDAPPDVSESADR